MENNKETKVKLKIKLEEFGPVQQMSVSEAIEYISFLMNNLNYIINVIPKTCDTKKEEAANVETANAESQE